MRTVSFKIFVCLFLLSGHATIAQDKIPYKNSRLPIPQRVEDLLSRMTVEEKVGQLLCPLGWEMYEKNDNQVKQSKKFEDIVKQKHIGMLWATFRADPWTKKTLDNGLNPSLAAEVANALQRYVVKNTRLGIPLFLAEEAPHGHMAIGTTVFPTGIGQASTWNPKLLEEMAGVTAKEVRLQGAHITYGPVLDLSRDHRWSRVEESFGEDPVLTAQAAVGIVKGLGGGNLKNPWSTIATLKHFVAYGIPEGGHNGSASSVGERELRAQFLPPFQAAINAGALSVMSAYNSLDGVPCTSSEFLLTTILRDEWGFKGFTVSDLGSIEGIKGSHQVAKNHQDAAVLAMNAGLDADLGGNAYVYLIEKMNAGQISTKVVDRAVSRVLTLKFEMGLFENPYVESKKAQKGVKTPAHIQVSRRVAQESLVLLENKNNVLPLKKGLKVALVGPNADNVYNMLGDYTAPQPDHSVVTVLAGLRNKLGANKVTYVKGCAIRDTTNVNIDAAVAAAQSADVIVAVVGGSSARDFKTKYLETGAAITSVESVSDMESGEGFDRATLDLLGKQMDLLKALKATGKPLVVVYIQGRPLNMNWASQQADALLCAWYPGQEGGDAIADVLFGDYNPAGRLPISVAKSVGQLPVHYNKRNPQGHDYLEVSAAPLYTFGYGKSFTTFEYQDLKIEKNSQALTYQVSFTLKNTGNYDGDEVAQLYIKNHFASVSQPNQQLRHFQRLHLKKGASQQVEFMLSADDFSIINAHMKKVVEPNSVFSIMIGAASNDVRLKKDLGI